MTVLEILEKRIEIYKGNLEKSCYSKDEKRDMECRVSELNNLIFIINTQNITGIKE